MIPTPMDEILDHPTDQVSRPEYAGFAARFVAYLIDFAIVYATLFALMFNDIADRLFSYGTIGSILLLIGLLSILCYFPLMESSAKQATLGKMLMRIKVGDQNGNRIGFLNAAGRLLAKMISGMIFYIGFLMVIWDKNKQGLHDKIAGTYVFKS